MEDRTTVSTSTLKSIGYKARDNNSILESLDLDGQNVRGNCIDIARYIMGELINKYNIPSNATGGIRCDIKDEEMHYLVYIDLKYVEDVEDSEGQLYIDASVDQFCDEQEKIGRVDVSFDKYENLPRVDLLKPDDSDRKRYQNVQRDVLHKPS